MKADDLIAFILEEAQHRVINDERSKTAESALAAHSKKGGSLKGKEETETDEVCENCDRTGHSKADCWSKGGGKEGQGPRQKRKAKKNETVVAADDDKEDLLAFTCTSAYVAVAESIDVPKSKLGTCMDSGASQHYCPDRSKFTDYRAVEREVTTADGRTLITAGMGDLKWHSPLYPSADSTKPVFRSPSAKALASSGTAPAKPSPPSLIVMDYTR